MYQKISNYGIIGNLHAVALIGLDGSIDWMCLPYIDSPSIFGALLDDTKGGRFVISPLDDWDSVAAYKPDTNILVTQFRTRAGRMEVTDFMPVSFGCEEELEEEQQELYRLVEATRGDVSVELTFEPRFDYARAGASIEKRNGCIAARGNDEGVFLSCTRDIDVNGDTATARWRLSEGDRVWVHLNYGLAEPSEIDPGRAEKALLDTEEYWRSWLRRGETGRIVDLGPYKGMIERSALVLKLLYYQPSGTIAAAATTSLPEQIGGERNWDYRYTWVRDTSFTLQALFHLGHLTETQGYLRWIERLLSEHGAEDMKILYGLRGEQCLPEQELLHLDGYKGSRPVRIGNGAARQKQLDIYGEIMDAALKLSDYVGKIDTVLWPVLRNICDYVIKHWQEPDHGIWEVRGGPYHFVYSKVMCWVALDRGITIARRYGFPADLETWQETRFKIKEEVLNRGWNEQKQAFVQHYETDALDASNLLLPILGFLPFDDPRVVSTIEVTQRELGHDGFLYRYAAEDGIPGGEGTFLFCTFWLITCLIALERLEEAETLLRRMGSTANHLGLFSEEYDVDWKEALGNFPQAFTHIGYINSVIALSQSKERTAPERKPATAPHQRLLLSKKIVLNDGEPPQNIPSREIAGRLKHTMNILRGAFFDATTGRVAYERMRKSGLYKKYLAMSYTLKSMGLPALTTSDEQLAFWINLYNVLVIHGVIDLGVRDSVKEVGNFFRRIQYQVGDMLFTPDDIEHGILRGNRRPPNSVFKVFKARDPRLKFIIQSIEPRIHFALVCASSSCPPIEVYTAEGLAKELTIAGETFVNGGGVKIQRERNLVCLSRVFRWYREDFGRNQSEVLRFIAPYVYKAEDGEFLEENLDRIKVTYQDYDWRLNRYRPSATRTTAWVR
jgi:GH15 family glucan-1,4-alpha-glucosidase